MIEAGGGGAVLFLENRGQVLMDCFKEDPDRRGRERVLGLPAGSYQQLMDRLDLSGTSSLRSRSKITLPSSSGRQKMPLIHVVVDNDYIRIRQGREGLYDPRFVPLSTLKDQKMRNYLTHDSLTVLDMFL